MSTRINHNILSMTAQRNLQQSQFSMDTALTRLSSGLRINYAWDDPAGLAVSERFRAQIASMEEAERNANYDMNLLATAEGALQVIDDKLIRMRALAVQASNGALTSEDRSYLNTEFDQLRSEITRIANTTNYNGLYLLNGSLSSTGVKFHIGTYNVANDDYYYVTMLSMRASDLSIDSLALSTTTSAQSAITTIDSAITTKDTERTRIGSYVERLQNTVLNLQIQRENATASESQIRDADIAAEMSNFVRGQILMQTGVSMLAQANQVPQIIAGLVG
ncbi:MAG TPA: flagellin [Bacteroidetes bacterium]|nr:flagellar filament 33 kDa core protein [bacterium BMS3Bbin04]HDO65761.1 flagellin [Bacteroidota bacterium]HEX04886.1 flagellin [Bacteroidota bacterium]